jgi:hypothetical protein
LMAKRCADLRLRWVRGNHHRFGSAARNTPSARDR